MSVMKKIAVLAIAVCLGAFLCSCTVQITMGSDSTDQASGSQTSETQTSQTQTTDGITEDEAKAIALADAGVEESELVGVYITRDYDDGREVYDVEFYTGSAEYDYEIAVSDGTILEMDFEAEYNFASSLSGSSSFSEGSASLLSQDEAAAIALERVSGATTSNLMIYYEIDDGRATYEGKIIYNGREYEFEIDASTGDVLEWEEEAI